MSDVATNLRRIEATLPQGVALVAVSKFHPLPAISEAYAAGQRVFGESRVQELAVKAPQLPDDIRWHFIGHLQTNKVRQLIRLRPALIESVDTDRLLSVIDAEAAKEGVVQKCAYAVACCQGGNQIRLFRPNELLKYFSERRFENLKATHICGVMGMASNTDYESRVLEDFRLISDTFREIGRMCPDLRGFDTVSMGMSHDYLMAVDCGSTMVRVGTAIFGDRY